MTLRIARCLFILHPAVALLYLVFFAALIFMFNHPVFVVTCFFLAVLQAFYFAGVKATMGRLKFHVPFGILVAVLTPVFNRRGTHVLFYLFDRPFTLEALAYGLYAALLLIGLLTVFITFNSVVSPGKFLYLFSKTAPQTAFIANMALRFSDTLKDKARDYMGVQQTRESAEDKRSMLVKTKNSGAILGAFSMWALEDGLVVSETLRAKEYGRYKRTRYETYTITKADIVFETAVMLIFAGICLFGLSSVKSYDYFKGLTDIRLDSSLWAAYALTAVYLLVPFCIDIFRKMNRRLAH